MKPIMEEILIFNKISEQNKVLNDEFSFGDSVYGMNRDVVLRGKVSHINISINGDDSEQSIIEAFLFDGNQMNLIFSLSANDTKIKEMLVSMRSIQEVQESALNQIAEEVERRLTIILDAHNTLVSRKISDSYDASCF